MNKKQQHAGWWAKGFYALILAGLAVVFLYASAELGGDPEGTVDRNVPGATTGAGRSSLAD